VKRPGLPVAVGLLLAAAPVAAQVNAEVLPLAEKPGWSGNIEGSLALSEGNVDALDLGVGFGLQKLSIVASDPPTAPFRSRVLFVASVRRSSAQGKLFGNRGFAHFRYTRMAGRRLGPDFFTQLQYDEFTRLELRWIGGAGIRWDVVRTEGRELWVGTGAMIERERLDAPSDERDLRESTHHRWTSYGALRVRLGKASVLANTVYIQPRWDSLLDVRLLEALDLRSRLAGRLAVGTALELRYDSRPPAGVRGTDVRLSTNVGVGF
jgi:hypothetical protein